MPVIQTVLGPIPLQEFGFALPHEHILVDFIGAEKTGRQRWNVEEVVQTMRPYLLRAKERGITGFVDCTPAYIGRDPRILKRLAQETGLHILTNTGYYGGAKDLYLPKHAFTETPEQLAARWVREWAEGIEGTGVKPGFMKIGIDEATGTPPRLSDVDAKLVRAAARASKKTGLSVTCHTQDGPGGLAAARLFAEETTTPARFIVAHSDGHGAEFNLQVAEVGAWVSFDGIGYRPTEEHLKLVTPMLEKWPDRLLLSMDSGWYWVGEPNGGKIREYSYLTDDFLPALRKRGFPDNLIRRLTVENPAKAFALSPK
jgi:phosphotriesterase-related protein